MRRCYQSESDPATCLLNDPEDVSNYCQKVVRERCQAGAEGLEEPVCHPQASSNMQSVEQWRGRTCAQRTSKRLITAGTKRSEHRRYVFLIMVPDAARKNAIDVMNLGCVRCREILYGVSWALRCSIEAAAI